MPEQSSTDVPDQGLRSQIRRYALILLLVALVLAVWGVVSRVLARSRCARKPRKRRCHRVTISPERTARGEELVLPGSAGLHRGPHLCAHQRLSEDLADRHRRR
jgi:hypothetical protein